MTKAQADHWAGNPDAAARLLALVEQWETEGYEPVVTQTKRGDLRVELRLDRAVHGVVQGGPDDWWVPPAEPDPFDDPVGG